MPAPEHRRGLGRRADPRLLLAASFALGVLVTAVVAFALTAGSGGSPAGSVGASGTTSPSTPQTQHGTAAGSSPSAAPSSPSPSASSGAPGGRLAQALSTKPLTQLQRGDRVVYNTHACRFRRWATAPEVAVITCPGNPTPFQVRTEELVPVEPD